MPNPQQAGKFLVVDIDKVNAIEGEALRWAIGRVLEGASLRSIAIEWNRRGLLTASNKTWDPRRVKEVLLRWRNAGVMQHQGEALEGSMGAWEPVCTLDDLRLLRGLLTAPDRRVTPGRTATDMLSAIARCGRCVRVMYSGKQRVVRKAGVLWFDVYRCSGAGDTTGKKCWTSIKRETLDALVTVSVRNRLTCGKARGLAPDAEERTLLMKLRTERQAISEEQAEVGRMIGSGALPASAALPALQGLAGRLEAVHSQIRVIESRYALGAILTSSEPNLFDRSARLAHEFKNLSVCEQRDIVKALVQVTVHPGRDPEKRVEIRGAQGIPKDPRSR